MNSNYKNVFAPIRIRGIDFKNRIFLAPTTPTLSTPDGLVTQELVDWLRMFARGGATVLNLGNCSIDLTESNDQPFQLDLGRDECIYRLSWYADMCKQYDCHASLEINHAGEGTLMTGPVGYSSSSFISDDELGRAERMGREPIPTTEMSKEKIHEIVEKFGMAAARMKRAGMDICLVHGGHGNLITQFTSPKFNKRTDEYGGSTKNRARFAIEVCDSIRRHCGEDFVIEYRCSGDEIDPEGMHIEETLEFVGYLKEHIDILHVSAGLHSDPRGKNLYYRNWCQNFLMDRCFNVHYARDIKKAHPDLLVNTVGSITSLDYAEEILANGWADFVSMCRPLIADPEMPNKYAENRPEDHRPCLRCDSCAKHLRVPKPMSCAVNPMAHMTTELRDGVVPRAQVKKKVAVIGGGPGGIQAMQTLLDRGHEVTLYEAAAELGGNIIPAAAAPFKMDLKDYLSWMRHTAEQCRQRGARILLNTPATRELLDAEAYDALVLAVGASPVVPASIPGIHGSNVAWAPTAELGQVSVGDQLVIVGAGSIGVEAALDFKRAGKKVVLIEAMSLEASTLNLQAAMSTGAKEIHRLLDEEQVEQHYNTKLLEVLPDSVICQDVVSGETITIPCDNVLLAMGMKARLDVVEELRRSAPETHVRIVGDCRKAATIMEAVNQAFQACLHL